MIVNLLMFYPLLSIHSSLPISGSRRNALNVCEEQLFQVFQEVSVAVNPELKDAIHYVLFRVKDRFSMSASLMFCRHLDLEVKNFGPLLSAVEFARCAVATTVTRFYKNEPKEVSYLDPVTVQEALFCLQNLASTIIVDKKITQGLSADERQRLLESLLQKASPTRILSTFRDSKNEHDIGAVFFAANGTALDILLKTKNGEFEALLNKLGVFTQAIEEFSRKKHGSENFASTTEKLEHIKTLESELFDTAATLNVTKPMTDLLVSLLEPFQSQLQ